MDLIRKLEQERVVIDSDTRVGGGGEGNIYPLPGSSSFVAKIYDKVIPGRARKLEAMIAKRPKDPNAKSGHPTYAWPVDILIDEHNVTHGFVMPWLTGCSLIHEVYIPGTRRQSLPGFHYRYLLQTARNLAAAFEGVHASGHVIGDVNESNVLVAPTTLISLIDTDSFQICDPETGEIFRCGVGKDAYTPPELIDHTLADIDRDETADRFGLAVLIHQLIMEGQHPFDGIQLDNGPDHTMIHRIKSGYCPHRRTRRVPIQPKMPLDLMHPTLADLVVRCFDDGHKDPEKRPNAREWRKALDETMDAIEQCSNNENHYFSDHLKKCPWCVMRDELRRDPFPAPGSPLATPLPSTSSRPMQPPPRAASSSRKVVVPVSTPLSLRQDMAAKKKSPSSKSATRKGPSISPLLRALGAAILVLGGGFGLYSTFRSRNIGDACTSGSQCSSHLCVKGACAPFTLSHGETCSLDTDCQSGRCRDGTCRECEHDLDCGLNALCKGSVCARGGLRDPCIRNSQCREGIYCSGGVCGGAGAPCTKNIECVFECNDGHCSASATPLQPPPALAPASAAPLHPSPAPARRCAAPAPWDGRVRGWAKSGQALCDELGYYVRVARNKSKEEGIQLTQNAWRKYVEEYLGDAPCPEAKELAYFDPNRDHGYGIFFPTRPPGWDRIIENEKEWMLIDLGGAKVTGMCCFFLAGEERRSPGY